MIVRSIRLKNIKSYGEGPNGDGVVVSLDAGINRIAGRNGHGKSTLIESLGYALFLTPPVFEENFDAATYLLRSGEKSGEIDVTFEHEGELYRIERGLGSRGARRSKVVQLSDGSIAAEDDQEVAAFLCRLLGAPSPDRLSDLFAKLIGVKQGRLTWPFDSKGADARKHFDPLLDVEIFRNCFNQLKPVVDGFDTSAQAEMTRLATIEERLRERQDAPARTQERRQEVQRCDSALTSSKAAARKAEEARGRWEALEKSRLDLRSSTEKAAHDAGLAKERYENAEQRLKESALAMNVIGQTAADHLAFVEAEKTLVALHEKQRERTQLEALRTQHDARRIKAEGEAASARAFSDDLSARRDARTKRAGELKNDLARRRAGLAATKEQFDREALKILQARKDDETWRHWIDSLEEKLAGYAKSIASIEQMRAALGAWDANTLKAAREREHACSRQLEELTGKLTASTELHEALKRQLAQIADGVCPFLKESCQQFDPEKVQGDARIKESDIALLRAAVVEARTSTAYAQAETLRLQTAESRIASTRDALAARVTDLQLEGERLMPSHVVESHGRLITFTQGKPFDLIAPGRLESAETAVSWLAHVREFHSAARDWFESVITALRQSFEAFDEARDRRLRNEQDLRATERETNEVQREIETLTQTLEAKLKEAATFRSQAEAETAAVASLIEKLSAFASLDQDFAEQQRRKNLHADGHQRYITAKPIADDLPRRQLQADEHKAALAVAEKALTESQASLQKAAAAIDPVALETARREFHERSKEASVAEEKLNQARRELEQQEKRLREYEQALQEKAAIQLELGRIEAAIALTEKARTLLKATAPLVAEHLCRRIAMRAQQIFNHINHEPAELEWRSDPYSLRVHPGGRRFAMLSGGEQTKLALAMTIAMIQEFSGLKFCVFDEPTYGVDGDSRLKLADAILAAQEVSGFDQLLLVSHDDVFDGRIEHSVRLTKTAGGTQPVVE